MSETTMESTKSTELATLRVKVEAGEALTEADALKLYETRDIHALGELANLVRERLHGRNAYYNINLHINYTNYCVLHCKFCSFYRPFPKEKAKADAALAGSYQDEEGGYQLSLAEVVDRARQAYAAGATEVHIVGGLHPRLPFSYYTEMLSAIRTACFHLHLKAFTAIEIIHFTRIAKPRLSIKEVLEELRAAGLDSLPGGGAEIFDERVHEEAFKQKVGEAEWFEVHRTAHELGIFTNATMLYGHLETPAERFRHLLKLRAHQEESLRHRPAHFNCVVPLCFIPQGSALAHLPGPTGLDDVRTLALTRLLCSNVPHIKAFWVMHTPKIAQISLNWGVDDLDGTVVQYDITKREAADDTHQELTVDQLTRLAVEAGCTPVERDSLYRRVIRTPKSWTVEGENWSVKYGTD